MLLQLFGVLATSIILFLANNNDPLVFISVVVGGVISIVNNYLIATFNNKQKNIKPENANTGLGLLVYSVVVRIIVVALLIFLSFKFGLLALEIIIGLVVGQIILVIGKLKSSDL